jgi:nucleoside recognition membrane protein YjiH
MQKKIYVFFLLLFFCGICFAQNTVSGKITTQGGMPFRHVHIGKKQYPRMFLGTILLKGCHQEMLKYLFPALVFNLLIRCEYSV